MSHHSPAHHRIPAFTGIYNSLHDPVEALLRFVTGALLIPHGCQKAFGWFGGFGITPTAGWFESQGYKPGMLWLILVMLTELVGGICLALGLFTRVAALAITIFMLCAIYYHAANGFFWTPPPGPGFGFEFPLLWTTAALFFLIRGGGPLSLDRKLGKHF